MAYRNYRKCIKCGSLIHKYGSGIGSFMDVIPVRIGAYSDVVRPIVEGHTAELINAVRESIDDYKGLTCEQDLRTCMWRAGRAWHQLVRLRPGRCQGPVARGLKEGTKGERLD